MNIELQKCLEILKNGGIILYPTDTVWGIGCDASNSHAIQKIFKLKNRSESKSMICLVNNRNMLNKYVQNLPKGVNDIIDNETKPTTIIYTHPKGLSPKLIAKDKTVAIRIVNDKFCNELIRKFNKPIVSTSANLSNFETPKSFKEIHEDILKGVDYVVNLPNEKKLANPSQVVKLKKDGTVVVIRA